MKAVYYHLPNLLRVIFLLLATIVGETAYAQDPTYSLPNSATSQQGCVSVKVNVPLVGIELQTICGQTSNIDKLADAGTASYSSYATISPPVLPVGSILGAPKTSIKVQMSQLIKAGSRAGMAVSGTGSLVDATLTGGADIVTYLGDAQKQIVSFSSLLGTNSLSDVPQRLDFIASQDFDNIEIRVGGTLNAYTLRAYYVYAFPSNNSVPYKGVLSSLTAPQAGDVSTTIKDKDGLTVCVNSTVNNPQNAVSASLTDYATFTNLASVSCPSTLNVKLASPAAKNYQAGFVVGSSSLLDVKALSNFKINTYLNGKLQESSVDASLLEVNVLPGGKYQISFPASLPFDRVELQQVGALATNVLSDLNIYYGFGIEQQAFRDQNPRQSKFDTATNNVQVNGANSLVCLSTTSCGINNAANAADNLLSNYATINSIASVGGTNRLRMRLNGTGGAAGNRAGVVLTEGGGLLDVSLLKNLTLRTYAADGTTLLETASGASLLDLSLLGSSKNEVSFLTTQPFSWVEMEVPNGLATVLPDTRLYYAFAEDARIGFPTNLTAPSNPLPVELVAFAGRATTHGTELTWKTASELNNSHFVVERTLHATDGVFQEIGRVAGSGTSTTGRQYSFLDAEAATQGAAVVYYRLRQVDVDGKESFSPVVAVAYKGEQLAASLQLAPNPTIGSEQVRVQIGAPGTGQQLLVYDVQGRLISQMAVEGTTTTLPTASLRQGLYQVVLATSSGQRLTSQRLVVAGR